MSPPEFGIPIDRQSRTATVAEWSALSGGRHVDAVDVGGVRELAFVPRELLVESRNTVLIDEVVAKFGRDRVEVVAEAPLLEPPPGMRPREDADLDSRPQVSVLRFRELPDVSERGAALVTQRLGERATVNSPDAARLLALISELAEDGHEVDLNSVGSPSVLPLVSALDSNPFETFKINSFKGRARIPQAWQLVEAFRSVRSLKVPVTVGVLDGGFWIAGRSTLWAPGQSGSDLGNAPMQVNLLDESAGVGGASGNKCGDSYSCPWHGNGVAGVAVAKLDNRLGTAGTGGTVAMPVLFKTDISKDQTYRALALCVAWGIDVLNISWSMSGGNFFFGPGSWEDYFRWATNNGLIVVCSAGNDNESIPDESSVRPATRTPGTITVGALDETDIAASFSNHGPSVDIWAPGSSIPTIPDGDFPSGSLAWGTSVAAPFVAGVVAMMRAVNPTLDSGTVKDILRRTAWAGQPGNRATLGLDAYAAVLDAMGSRLPSDLSEANDTPEFARPLVRRGPPNQFGTSSQALSVISASGDVDWHRFELDGFAMVDILTTSYPLLGAIKVELFPDDPDSRAAAELVVTIGSGRTRMTALIAPGTYRLKVSGGINLYELTATITPFTLLADEFEPNDSFDSATRFTVRSIHQGGDVTLGPIAGIFDVPAGTYDLTIHNPSNPDFFGIRTGAARESTRPILRIGKTDAPMDVTLYDESRNEISRHEGVRHLELELPVSTVTFIKISAKTVTRYRFTTGQEYDKRRVPEAYQEELVFSVPVPGDRPNWMGDDINYLAFEVDERAMDPQIIRLAAVEGPALTADILDENREVMFSVAQDQQSRHEVLSIDTHGLAPGTYVVRLSALNQPDDAPQGFAIEGVPRF